MKLSGVWLSGVLVTLGVAAGIFYVATENTCSPILEKEPEMSSHGYRVWSGPTLKSFNHENNRVCVPEGWQALGATAQGAGWATFEFGKSGVIIRLSAFTTKTLEFANSAYEVTVWYPGSSETPLAESYVKSIENAFEGIGGLFGDSYKNKKRQHTILITPGIEGTTSADGIIRVYPDPNTNLTTIVETPESIRGEELLIHAVSHLYNRFRKDLIEYQKLQSPIPPQDWQELEASWSETAFRTSASGRRLRLAYLYNVHVAVQTHDISLTVAEPFNNPESFESIRPTVVTESGASFAGAQYSHYILGPLTLVATEGLLQKYNTGTNVEAILKNIHRGKVQNFFTELRKVLPSKEVTAVEGWMLRGETIPRELVLLGATWYESR